MFVYLFIHASVAEDYPVISTVSKFMVISYLPLPYFILPLNILGAFQGSSVRNIGRALCFLGK